MKRIIILLSILTITTGKTVEYCDIKGAVNNPGVYEIKENYTIQDIIKNAGGLKKNSYTNNINLSKKVTDEMVIYIFTKDEIKNATKMNNCECTPTYKYIECKTKEIKETTTTVPETSIETTTQPTTKTTITIPTSTTTTITTKKETTTKNQTQKININTATLEELISLDGLGETKAQKIIEYRTTNGLFNSIEDILNVKGIGKTIFENIKEHIEV